jgi:cellulose synthase/poly-beta-1,6-N-acetylglucosamine synthase-like glycosyltransferase
MRKKKYVSVVVPAYNANSTISMCIESLLNLDYPKDKLEIILVDNNSSDETPDLIKAYPVTYLMEKKRGPAAARNTGAKFAKGEFIAFTDADCIVTINWLKHLINGMENSNVAGCGGEVLPYKVETSLDRYCAMMFWPIKRIIEGELYGYPYIITANAIYRKSVLEEVDYFDESFPVAAHEDTDLGWRISKKGGKLKYVPDAKLFHCHRTTLIGLYKVGFKGGYGADILYNKHINFKAKRPLNIIIELRRLIKCFLNLIINPNPEHEKVFDFFHILFRSAYLAGFINSKINRRLRRLKN